jgi:hypothetical protein
MGIMLRWSVLLLDFVHQAGASAVVEATGWGGVSVAIRVAVLRILAYHEGSGQRAAR